MTPQQIMREIDNKLSPLNWRCYNWFGKDFFYVPIEEVPYKIITTWGNAAETSIEVSSTQGIRIRYGIFNEAAPIDDMKFSSVLELVSHIKHINFL